MLLSATADSMSARDGRDDDSPIWLPKFGNGHLSRLMNQRYVARYFRMDLRTDGYFDEGIFNSVLSVICAVPAIRHLNDPEI